VYRATAVSLTAREDAERPVQDCQRRIANLTGALANVGWSEGLAAKLREEEELLAKLKAQRGSVVKTAAPPLLPAPDVIAGYLRGCSRSSTPTRRAAARRWLASSRRWS
jgi:hypothetical protein